MARSDRFLPPWASDVALTVFRVVVGALFAVHGASKLFGVLDGFQPPAGSQLWIGGVIELVCGALVAVGLFTRAAAFLASGTMAVAYIQFHWKGQGGDAFFPSVNQGELALVYAVAFLHLAASGGGRYGLDALRR